MAANPFKKYLELKPLFKGSSEVLGSAYIPETLPHREEQINQLASILVNALRGNKSSNVLVFGKTGTGKTAVIKYMQKEMYKLKDESQGLHYFYINCEQVDTAYCVLQTIGNRLVTTESDQIPFTGWPLERVYTVLKKLLDSKQRVVIVALDEVDKLVYKSGDDVLYSLLELGDTLENAKLSLIGISNDTKFTEFLDARVQSRLGEEKIVFPPYNAEQLKDILNQRVKLAFENDVVDSNAIALCAAFAAQEHGDARRALSLLRVAAEIAERYGDSKVDEYHVKKAKSKLELDCALETVRTLPTQSKLLLLAVLILEESQRSAPTTGEVYSAYRHFCKKIGLNPVSQRRISELISELDMLGVINAHIKSFGRGGKTRVIQLSVPFAETKQVIAEDTLLEPLKDYKFKIQTTLI